MCAEKIHSANRYTNESYRGLLHRSFGERNSFLVKQRRLIATNTNLEGRLRSFEETIHKQEEIIAKQSALTRSLEEQSLTDPLTKLPNRRAFDMELVKYVDQCLRYNQALSLIMCDVDGLKSVNDAYGHPTGDLLITSAAKLMQSVLRKYERIFRLGGDEFALILYPTAPNQAIHIAKRLRNSIEKKLLTNMHQITQIRGITFERSEHFSISIGIAGILPESLTGQELRPYTKQEELIRRADIALYHSKKDIRTGEGLNNKIKVIKRRCYGVFDIDRLFQRISLDLSGYAQFA